MISALPTVLFVDDETAIIDGLRRNLSSQESHWQILFASGGANALEIMERQAVDVVVADMRMPGMDGAALLGEVRRRYPATIRFILSGFADRDSFLRTLMPTHQYFAKPCDMNALMRAVDRALAIRQRLRSPELLALIAGCSAIPTFPRALMDLFEAIQSPNGSVAEVARIISSDVGMTAQVLRLVNSSYFSLPSRVSDVLQAVHLLGFEVVRSVAMVSGVFGLLQTAGVDMEMIRNIEELSLATGAIALRIARQEGIDKGNIDQIQCAGMLAHIGSLFLFANRPQEAMAVQQEVDRSGEDIIAVERRQFGASHAELGGALLRLWGFSDQVVEAVLFHHSPTEGGIFCADCLGPVDIVHVAQGLARIKTKEELAEESWKAGLDLEYLTRVGAVENLDKWAKEVDLSRLV